MCPHALGAQADRFIRFLSAGALAMLYELGGAFRTFRLVICLYLILDGHPYWMRRNEILRINPIPPCELIKNF